MAYFLDLFTGTTWDEFRKAGAAVTGFRPKNKNRAAKIKAGDMFLCYVTGVKMWVGLLKVTGPMYEDKTPIWQEEVFPIRLPVEPVVMLDPEFGVMMNELEGKLSFFPKDCLPGRWTGLVRSSPQKYQDKDGDVIAAAIKEAKKAPVNKEIDKAKLKRPSSLYKLKKEVDGKKVESVVVIPSADDEVADEAETTTVGLTHTEIQWRLLDLGCRMGLNVWAPKPDRGRSWNGKKTIRHSEDAGHAASSI
ncbi:MAG: hypothetical protein AB7I37_02910 [Pirellulales bacterium]